MPSQTDILEDDGGFSSHVSSRQFAGTKSPSASDRMTFTPPAEKSLLEQPKPAKKEKSGKKSKPKKMEEFDYEAPHAQRAPIVFEDRPGIVPGNHPLLEMNAPRLDTKSASGVQSSVGISVLPSERSTMRPELTPDERLVLNLPSSDVVNGSCQDNYVTLTGTIKRGHKKNQVVEVELKLTQAELDQMNKSTITVDDKEDGAKCGLRKGLHILLLTVLFFPFALISSLAVCFYVGTMCWYNIYLNLSEERTIWHKAFLCPLLILFYPVLIILSAFGIGLYAAVIQISWFLSSWLKEIKDFDKGFYGWLCSKLRIPECAPYEVVILDDTIANGTPTTAQSSV